MPSLQLNLRKLIEIQSKLNKSTKLNDFYSIWILIMELK